MAESSNYDVVVIGAGVFGAWTAWHLAQRKKKVLVLDAYGAAHSRASSGGETRIIRMSYATDEIYTRWSQRSLVQWKELSAATGQQLFRQTGVLWMEGEDIGRLRDSQAALERCGIAHEIMENAALTKRYPQVNFDGVTRALLEPGSGVLMARRGVQTVDRRGREKRRGVSHRAGQAAGRKRTAGEHHDLGRRNHLRRTICICLRAVAWQGFPGTSRPAHFSHAAGSVLLRRTRGR